jgi:hypothetical protein
MNRPAAAVDDDKRLLARFGRLGRVEVDDSVDLDALAVRELEHAPASSHVSPDQARQNPPLAWHSLSSSLDPVNHDAYSVSVEPFELAQQVAQQDDSPAARYAYLHRIGTSLDGTCRYTPSARLPPEIQDLDTSLVQ